MSSSTYVNSRGSSPGGWRYHWSAEILVEGPSKNARKQDAGGDVLQLTGRTDCDRIVVFDGTGNMTGQMLSVRIDSAN